MKLIKFVFISKRLEVDGRPELDELPRNILFINDVQLGGYGKYRLSLYNPDLSTFEILGGKKQMSYLNAHGGNSQIVVTKQVEGYYSGVKIIDGKESGNAAGETWKNYFLYLSLLGRSFQEVGVEVMGSQILDACQPENNEVQL